MYLLIYFLSYYYFYFYFFFKNSNKKRMCFESKLFEENNILFTWTCIPLWLGCQNNITDIVDITVNSDLKPLIENLWRCLLTGAYWLKCSTPENFGPTFFSLSGKYVSCLANSLFFPNIRANMLKSRSSKNLKNSLAHKSEQTLANKHKQRQ